MAQKKTSKQPRNSSQKTTRKDRNTAPPPAQPKPRKVVVAYAWEANALKEYVFQLGEDEVLNLFTRNDQGELKPLAAPEIKKVDRFIFYSLTGDTAEPLLILDTIPKDDSKIEIKKSGPKTTLTITANVRTVLTATEIVDITIRIEQPRPKNIPVYQEFGKYIPHGRLLKVFSQRPPTVIPHLFKVLLRTFKQWNIHFQQDRGAPSEIKVSELKSWSENEDAGVKYFSGTATYTKSINAPANWITKGSEIWLDLGEVKNIAEVKVNGKLVGTVWKSPFKVNVTSAWKTGDNKIEINVTNLWVNRLIGDAQPGVTNKITFTTMPFYQANSKLLPSGLLGPVKIISVAR